MRRGYNPGLLGLTPRLGKTINWQDPQLQGLEAWFPLVEGGGAIIRDESRVARQGTFQSPAWIHDGVVGAAVPDFNGTTGKIDVSFYVPPIGTAPRTITAWIAPDVTGLNGTIAAWGATATGQKWVFRTDGAANTLRVEISGSGFTGTLAWTPATWTFVAVTFQGTTLAGHTLFVGDQSEAATGANSVNTASTNGLAIGHNVVDNSQWFDGRIRDLRIYHRALTAAELQIIRTQPFRPFILRGLEAGAPAPDPADEEALAWLTGNQAWNPALPVGGTGALSEADRQHLLHGLRDPIWRSTGGSLIAQQMAWYDAGVGV